MYYYKETELGTFPEAKEKILADKAMARSLIDAYLFNTFDERYLREMVVDTTVDGRGLTMEWLVEDALEHMSDMWDGPEDGCIGLGYFQFDDQEGEE